MDIEIDLETSKKMTHSLISDLKNKFPEIKGVPDKWKLGLSDEEMTDIAKHHLRLPNFKGVIPKYHIPVFTQYVIEAAPCEQGTVLINTARASEPGKHWVALHCQPPPTDYRACQDGCLVEYFDSYGVANLLPEINHFIEEVSPFNPVRYNFVNLQDFSDDQSICGYRCLYFAFMKHKKPELCDREFYKAYPDNGRVQHENELHLIHFMEHHMCVNNK